tara:strand:+ start:180 stop:893 length:714 start_codon:yes stop_codon:yes gene_type:complete
LHERTHLDLFSGIGGFAIAAKWAGFRTLGFCENDPFCRGVLADRNPGIPIHGDIRKLDGRMYRGRTYLATGGFPCQPWSRLGHQRGKEDDRDLFGEMARVCREAKPTFILLENVYGLVKDGLDSVLAELASMGFASQTFVVGSSAVDAPHRRDRVWILAHSSSDRLQRSRLARSEEEERAELEEQLARCRGVPRPSWEALPNICGVIDGLPNRAHRIRALGNAIVPQVAFEFLNLIP